MQKKSFTLIEMLIVVVIIGILAAALIPRLQSVQARARDTKRKADLHQIGTAREIYKEDNGGFNAISDASATIPSGGRCSDNWPITDSSHLASYYGGTENIAYMLTLLQKYMTAIPLDSNMSSSWKANGCQEVFGYLSSFMPRRGRSYDSVVLSARMESDGSSSNRVSNILYVGQGIVTGNDTYPWVGAINGAAADMSYSNTNGHITIIDYGHINAQLYDNYLCTKVTFDSGTFNDGSGNCTADKNGDDLRYLYVQ